MEHPDPWAKVLVHLDCLGQEGKALGNVLPTIGVAVCAKPSLFVKRTNEPIGTVVTSGLYPPPGPSGVGPLGSLVR